MADYLFTLPSTDGLPMFITAWLPEKSEPAPVIVFLPGLKGFVNWGGWPTLAARFAAVGYVVLGLDYSHSGVPNHGAEFTRLDLAEMNSPSLQVEEGALLLNAIERQELPIAQLNEAIDPDRIFLWGHSLGGGTALRLAAQRSELIGVVTWASVSQLGLWPAERLTEFRTNGRLNFPNARTGEDYWLGRAWLNDLDTWGEHGIKHAAAELNCPLLIVHGSEDPSVPVASAHALFAAAGPDRSEICIIEGADHVFNVRHPYAGSSPEFEKAFDKTINWLNAHSHSSQKI